MKAFTSSFVCWPKFNIDMESFVKSCEECKMFKYLALYSTSTPTLGMATEAMG